MIKPHYLRVIFTKSGHVFCHNLALEYPLFWSVLRINCEGKFLEEIKIDKNEVVGLIEYTPNHLFA